MKKQSFIIIVLGLILVIFGAVSFSFKDDSTDHQDGNENVDNNDDNGNEDEKPPKDSLVVDTSLIDGDEINSTMYDYYKVNNLLSEEIKSEDLSVKNKYNFAYSNDFNNVIVSGNSVRAVGLKTSFSALMVPTSYNLDVNHFIEYYKRLGFDLFKTYESKNDIKISGYSVKYMKIIAKKSKNNNPDNYREHFIIFVEESDDYRFMIKYEIIDRRFTDDILTNFLKKIKIEKNAAKYLYTTSKDGKINGILKQNAESDVSSFYEVSYNTDSNKYVEVENGYNGINYNSFSLKSNSNINISLKTVVYNAESDFLSELVGSVYENSDNLKVINSSTTTVSIKGKSLLKAYVSFSTRDNKTLYKTAVAYKISNNVYYVVTIDSDSTIPDSMFEDFVDITYKMI